MPRFFVRVVAVLTVVLMTAWGPARAASPVPDIDTGAVAAAMDKPDWVIVDTRLNSAFNGWKLDRVSRGGHIPGAVDFSANWLRVDEKGLEKNLEKILAAKGILPEKHVVLYDANGRDARAVAAFLSAKGYSRLYLYDIHAWANTPGRSLVQYPNYHRVVPAAVVKAVIDGQPAETFDPGRPVKIVEASWGAEKTSYAKGHIPGAFHINTDRMEPPTTQDPVMWMLADDKTLAAFALAFGFTRDDTVIVTSEEPLAAYRVATVLRYIGVNDVRVLNGGTLAWTLAGFDLETRRHDPVPVTDFGGPIPGNPDVIDTIDEVKAGLKAKERFTLVDNRTWREYIGEVSGYSYHKKKGRIPGAVYGYAGRDSAYGMEHYRNPDKTMRNAREFLALWAGQGIDTATRLSFMCGSGWRAAEVYYYADVIGLKEIAVFSDGWIGWSNTPGNPVEMGTPDRVNAYKIQD
ncbi:MAG: rhodanese-like domain-containing protein [Desulfobacter sp.]